MKVAAYVLVFMCLLRRVAACPTFETLLLFGEPSSFDEG